MVQKSCTLLLSVLVALSYTAQAQAEAQTQPQPTASQILSSHIDMNDIRADFVFAPALGGGVQVMIDVQSGLTKEFAISSSDGFEYHIHVKPVGLNNDCMTTGGHLDPKSVKAAKCVPAKADKCQEGDLSGKHGELKATDTGKLPTIVYVDHQLQLSGDTATIAGRSVVIHNNGTRIACGDILPIGISHSSSSDTATARAHSRGNVDEAKTSQHMGDSRVVGWNAAMSVACMLVSGILGMMIVF